MPASSSELLLQPSVRLAASSDKLQFIDQMRGLAILGVMSIHVVEIIPFLDSYFMKLAAIGFIGVQLFFVASAYTLCLSFERRKSEEYPVISFYIRRYFRIAPLYYLAIPVYFALRYLEQFITQSHTYALDAYTPLNIISNLLLIHGLVPPAINSIVPGGWSIGTEYAFYACFPLLFYIFYRIARTNLSAIWLLLLLGLCVNVISQSVLAYYSISMTVKVSFFPCAFLPNHITVFLLGMIAYFLHQNPRAVRFFSSRAFSLAGFVIFFGITFVFTYFLEYALILLSIPLTSGISFFFLLHFLRASQFNSPILCRIGQCSYSMYIIHFAVVWAIRVFLSRYFEGYDSRILYILTYTVVATVTFGLAIISESTIERYGILLGSRIVKRIQKSRSVQLPVQVEPNTKEVVTIR